jgi:hypothetical protein
LAARDCVPFRCAWRRRGSGSPSKSWILATAYTPSSSQDLHRSAKVRAALVFSKFSSSCSLATLAETGIRARHREQETPRKWLFLNSSITLNLSDDSLIISSAFRRENIVAFRCSFVSLLGCGEIALPEFRENSPWTGAQPRRPRRRLSTWASGRPPVLFLSALGRGRTRWAFLSRGPGRCPTVLFMLEKCPHLPLRDHQTTHMSYQYCRRLSVPLSTQGNGDTSPPALVRFNCSISRHDVEYQSRASNLFGGELLGVSRSGLEACSERLAEGATNSE